jgi:HEPN domain-containing protein
VEKYLKAFLVYGGIDFPKTHDVDYLLSKSMILNCEIFDSIDFKNLTEFGVIIRYPDDFYVPNVSETQYYIHVALRIKTIIYGLIKLS